MTPPELSRDCWKLLVSAPARKTDGFKTLTVATVTLDGRPDARTVVLRQADERQKMVYFHTDRRAAKVSQLQRSEAATLLFWDEHRQIQLRLRATVSLHTDDALADEHWQKLWVGGRKTYLSEQQPGSEQPDPYPGFPPHLGEELPTPEESEAGRPNFAVVACSVSAVEYLHLSRAGQQRALFQYVPDERYVWLAP